MGVSAANDVEGWIRWHPAIADDPRYELMREAVESFEPPSTDAGTACAKWLVERSLHDWPYTATWVLYTPGRLHGFFALRSSVLNTTMEDGGRAILPCSQIEWLCKREGGKFHGRTLIRQASARALEVSMVQGNVALLIEPYDEKVADLLLSRHEFLRTAEQGHLWLPLYHEVELS